MRTFILAGAFLLLSRTAFSQEKEIETRKQTWFGYLSQTRLTKRSGIWLDLHLRFTNDFINQKNINILRGGYIYYITDQTRLSAGYAYVTQYGLTPEAPNIPEHRPWQQIQWFDKKNGFNLMQWLRVEQRFRTKVEDNELANGYDFNWRLRYNFSATVPLTGKVVAPHTPFFFFNNETHINAGKEIVHNYFDQNRFFVGFGYQFTSHLNAHIGYMNVFQQLPAGNRYADIHAIRLFVFHNMDFRSDE